MRDEEIKNAFESVTASEALKQKGVSAALTSKRPRQRKPGFIAAMAAIAAVFVLAFSGYGAYMQPSAYISIDVNPSIELSLNKANRVVNAVAYNSDGEAVLSGLDLKGKYYEDAIDEMMEEERKAGYLNEGAYIVFAVQSNDPAQEQQLITGTQQCAQQHHGEAQAEFVTISAQTREQAHEHGMSPGKYQTFLELQTIDPSITVKDCEHMSMHDMKTKLAACANEDETHKTDHRGGSAGNDDGNPKDPGHGNGHGYGRHHNQ